MRAEFIEGGWNKETYVNGCVYWDEADKEFRVIQDCGDTIKTALRIEVKGEIKNLRLHEVYVACGKYMCVYESL